MIKHLNAYTLLSFNFFRKNLSLKNKYILRYLFLFVSNFFIYDINCNDSREKKIKLNTKYLYALLNVVFVE